MAKGNVSLEHRLILHYWMNDLFSYKKTRDLLRNLAGIAEGFDGEGRSFIFYHLYSRGDRIKVPLEDLERYDANIRLYLESINRYRPEPVMLRYFQYLAVLYTEVFLDRRFNNLGTLIQELNDFAGKLEVPVRFDEEAVNKLAFWMATGSGKTLLMHINYLQYLHYNDAPLDNILLITPNAGLTEQHLEELRMSGIPCEPFSAEQSGLGLTAQDIVRVIEITKLKEEKKGQGVSVEVGAFEGRNLIFVDEGHKGAGSGDDAKGVKAWRPLRNKLAQEGFTFEYSATFGQAIQASKSEELAEEYSKAILFDYSYRYFYEDGFGKDFRILNLKNQTDEYTDLLLLGNLVSFYEQRRYYDENRGVLKPYKLEQPLWIFVGSNVNKEGSDVVALTRFLQRFLKNDANWSVNTIEKLLGGGTELRDGDGRDVFAGRYPYLKREEGQPQKIYEGVLREIFHAEAGGTLRVVDIKGSEGEIGLKVAGAERYFGLIFIGNTSDFKKLLETEAPDVVVEDDSFVASLFEEIDEPDSRVNILIGAKKFIEGWSSWRVSSMGLLNVGTSEGSQIIQLFGRGVRLKGRDLSLKRSSFVGRVGEYPEHIDLLETLNIFAIKANYMSEFRKYLEREGVDPGGYEEIPFPIRRKEELINENLYVPNVPRSREFSSCSVVTLDETENISVNLDLSARTESVTMGEKGIAATAAAAGQECLIEEPYLSMLDWSSIYLRLVEYKNSQGHTNLVIPRDAPRRIMENRDPASYKLVADDSLAAPKSFPGVKKLQGVVQTILQKYVDKFYSTHQRRWDSDNMRLEKITESHPNFADYTVKIKASEKELVEEVKALSGAADAVLDGRTGGLPSVRFDRHLYQPLLMDRGEEIKVSPPGLNDSERTFVAALRDYCEGRNGGNPSNKKLFLLRNLTKSKGIGFFSTSGFYPDFILWIKDNGHQKVVFIEPHGMRNDDPPPYNEKVVLYERLRELSDRIAERGDDKGVRLDSYIVSATPYAELKKRWAGVWDHEATRDDFAEKHVLFEDNLYVRIQSLVEGTDGG